LDYKSNRPILLINRPTFHGKKVEISPCSFGLSATSQQYFSLRRNQPSATSQQYFSLKTNQHQPSATSQSNRLRIDGPQPALLGDKSSPAAQTARPNCMMMKKG
jgi:hypothetical protein